MTKPIAGVERQKEQWRDILGYDGQYQISNFGRVRTVIYHGSGRPTPLAKPKIRSLSIDPNGYVRVRLRRDSKSVHRLVLETFVGPCPDGMETAHIDGSRLNNRLENLKWCSRKENHSHKHLHGTAQCGENQAHRILNNQQVIEIRRMRKAGAKIADIGKVYGVGRSCISAIITRSAWKHLGEELEDET